MLILALWQCLLRQAGAAHNDAACCHLGPTPSPVSTLDALAFPSGAARASRKPLRAAKGRLGVQSTAGARCCPALWAAGSRVQSSVARMLQVMPEGKQKCLKAAL